MSNFLAALLSFFEKHGAALLAIFGITTAQSESTKRKQAEEKADALEKRMEVEKRVSDMPVGSAADELQRNWNRDERRKRVRGLGTHTGK
jgi:hypothetical protein